MMLPKGLEDPTLENIERAHIISTLDKCKWNATRTAKILGISRATLCLKIKKYREQGMIK